MAYDVPHSFLLRPMHFSLLGQEECCDRYSEEVQPASQNATSGFFVVATKERTGYDRRAEELQLAVPNAITGVLNCYIQYLKKLQHQTQKLGRPWRNRKKAATDR